MASLSPSTKGADTTGWKARHKSALIFPNATERPIVHLLQAWESYAIEYKRHYEDALLGSDYVLGAAWKDIGASLRTMLNGELGRLDGGTLDSFILSTMTEHGIDTKEL